MFKKLYYNYLNMDKGMLWLQILIYTCLNISFGYTLYSNIQKYLTMKKLQSILTLNMSWTYYIIPVVTAILLVCFVPQLLLMILVKLGINPYYKDPKKEALKAKKKKQQEKFRRRKNRKFKDESIVSFEERKKINNN